MFGDIQAARRGQSWYPHPLFLFAFFHKWLAENLGGRLGRLFASHVHRQSAQPLLGSFNPNSRMAI